MNSKHKKTLLVLGAGSDIGLETAKVFATNGFDVILASRNIETSQAISIEWRKTISAKITVLYFDALATQTHQNFCEALPSSIDVVLIAFGITGDEEQTKQGKEDANLLLQTNFTGVVSIIHSLLNTHKIVSGSSIIIISSAAGEKGKKTGYMYGASKAALSFYADGLRAEMFSKKIHVLTVKPGHVQTKLLKESDTRKWITGSCTTTANDIYHGWLKRKNIIYTPWYWAFIAFGIKCIPVSILKRLNF